VTRGNHFHRRKFERFVVLSGVSIIRLRKIFSNEVVEFCVGGDGPGYIDIPTLHTHSITNVGDGPLLTLFWANELYDKDNPDTYFEEVIK
jgi:UDP-2-acetamido-2,6-beta-L-arabino-hexul-4-ose reductase